MPVDDVIARPVKTPPNKIPDAKPTYLSRSSNHAIIPLILSTYISAIVIIALITKSAKYTQ
jgi:hypothetical protein